MGLSDEEWAHRLSLLNHINMILLAWRGHQIDMVDDEELESWVAKAKLSMANVRENPVAKRQLQLLLKYGEGGSDRFRCWMFECGILHEGDGV